jgi:tetratricopeptide (TPR) repeat protein
MNKRLSAAFSLATAVILLNQSSLAATTPSDTKSQIELNVLRGLANQQDLTSIQNLLSKNPNDAEGHFVAGEVLNALGFQSLAKEQFDASRKNDKQYFLTRYHELLKRGGVSYVYPISHYAVDNYPSDSAVLYVQARRYMDSFRDGLSAEFFRKALTANPVWPGIYTDLAQLLYRQHRLREALEYANKAIQVDKTDNNAHCIRAMALSDLSGKPEKYTRELLEASVRKNTDDKVQLTLATGYFRSGQYDKAIEPVLLAIKYGGAKTLEPSQELLKQLMYKVSKEKIVSELDIVSPSNASDVMSTLVRMRVAKSLSDIGAHRESTKMLLQALQMSSFLAPAINYKLAEEFRSQNQHQEALFFYKSAHELKPDDEQYERAYLRAASRFQNKENDLARKIKLIVRPGSKS